MSATDRSPVGVLARQEMRNYARSPLFWVGAVLSMVTVATTFTDADNTGATTYALGPAALLGVLGIIIMFGLTRRSDRAADAAGSVAVAQRTRTLALASAAAVPGAFALALWVAVMVAFALADRPDWLLPPGTSTAFVMAQGFGDGVIAAVGGPLLGLLLARWIPRRGTAVIAAVVMVVVTILLQGNFAGGQPYRTWWVWTYFVGQLGQGWSSDAGTTWHMATAPGNPFIWLGYLVVLCALAVCAAMARDRESERSGLVKVMVALGVVAVVLGIATMTVGYSDVSVNPLPCQIC